MGCFSGLHCICLVVCVWEERLFHTVNMDAMLECVSVSVGAWWRSFSYATCPVFFALLNYGSISSLLLLRQDSETNYPTAQQGGK